MTYPANESEASGPGRAGSTGPPPGGPVAADLTLFWERAPAMLAVVDYDGYFQLVNPALRDALGWSENELRSVPSWVFLHPDDQHRVVETTERNRRDDSVVSSDQVIRILCRDGSYRWSRWSFRSVSSREIHYWVGNTIDDGSRPDPGAPELVGTWDWNITTNSLTWSEEVYRMFGLPPDTPVAYPDFLAFIHPEDRATVGADIQRNLAPGQEFSDDFRVVRPDGRVRWVRSTGRLLPGEATGSRRMVGIAVDITERRERGML
ncbi:PAS domain-containing protein [Pseudonocardia acidicola]|uniref:histidine kinase n=1 Tax=Pseudonocardia acidicola TaxID=2724939 RepID=A0ABX1SC62_9PSEU|nr:PAS domain-containing protein [Pseudonocardia acidicola]NMH99161.1 PAS domain-containing protein [Pseudonocardia acidicola]